MAVEKDGQHDRTWPRSQGLPLGEKTTAWEHQRYKKRQVERSRKGDVAQHNRSEMQW